MLLAKRNTRIEVKVSPEMSERARSSPYLKWLIAYREKFLNCSCPKCFSPTKRSMTALHESGHFIYSRNMGGDPEVTGPVISYNEKASSAPDGTIFSAGFALCDAQVLHTVPTDARTIDIIKIWIAGFVFREELTGSTDDRDSINGDMHNCRQWYQRRVGGTEDDFQKAVAEAKAEIIQDLRSPQFRQEAWKVARQIEKEVFGVAEPAEVCSFESSDARDFVKWSLARQKGCL